ncbi:MAG: formate dehydrogenase accessory sulfurtransferase FdhD [Actinomycetota bacterium]|nr:formate dehydrogenase accessory sulfurtransferase FdhD [Actinomycetota bacterium]
MKIYSRHNCLDKVVGYMARAQISSRDKIVHSSGRISIEIVGKAARMQIPVLISNSSVTHGAALLGRDLNLTVIGYAREARFNIYSGTKRVK